MVFTPLQALRKAIGISQKELSEKSGVTLRMIQQYEQRAKNINKAMASSLFALNREVQNAEKNIKLNSLRK